MDKTKPKSEQNLVDWARPYLSSSRKLRCIVDPKLAGQYSVKGAREMAALALQCVSPHPKDRPRMPAIVQKLECLQSLRDMAVSCGQWPATPKSSRNGVSSSSLSMFSSSLAIFFCLFLSWVSSSASPSPAPAPAFAASEYLRSRGYSLFAAAMDAARANAHDLIGGWNGTGTIFAPPDFAFSSATARFKNRGASSPLKQSSSLLHYHTLRKILRYQDLRDRPDSEAFATFSSQRCIFKTKNHAGDLSLSAKKKLAGDYVTIRQPDLYVCENLIVHGVDGALDPLSASKCAIDEADLEANTATASASSPVAAIDLSYLDHAVRVLRRRGFSVVATAMTMRRSDLMSLTAVTVFAPRDGSLFAVDDGFRFDFRYHVVQQRLHLRDLAGLPNGTEIETVAPGETVVVRPINGDVTVNGARVGSSEIYRNDWIVILEISNPLSKSDGAAVVPAGSPVTSKNFSVIFEGLLDPDDSRSYLSPSPEKELDNTDLADGEGALAPANALSDGVTAPDSGDIIVINAAPIRSSDVSVRPPSRSPASMASFSGDNVQRSPDVRSR